MIGFPYTQFTDPLYTGVVDILTRTNDSWSYGTRMFSPEPVSSGSFGYSMALSGSDLLIGAPMEDAGLDSNPPVWDAGAAYVFSMPSLTKRTDLDPSPLAGVSW